MNFKSWHTFQSDSDSDIIPADWYSESPETLVPILLNRNQERREGQENSTRKFKKKENIKVNKGDKELKVNKHLKEKRRTGLTPGSSLTGETKPSENSNESKRFGTRFSDYLVELVLQDSSSAYPSVLFPSVLEETYDFELENKMMQYSSKN